MVNEYKVGDWVIALSNSNHHSESKWFNAKFDFEIGKAYQIQDIEERDCLVFKLEGSSMRKHGCRLAKPEEIPIEYRTNYLQILEIW